MGFFIRISGRIHEGIIRSVERPWAAWNLGKFNEAPVDWKEVPYVEIITNRWGNIDTCAFITGILGTGITEDVIIVGGVEGATIFPLGIANPFIGNDLHPAALADRLSWFWIVAFKPWDHSGGLLLMHPVVQAIVIGQCDIKGIELWGEVAREISIAVFRVIVSPEIFLPILIPRGLIVGCWISRCRLFANPKDSGRDIFFPRIDCLLIVLWVRWCSHYGDARTTLCKESRSQ